MYVQWRYVAPAMLAMQHDRSGAVSPALRRAGLSGSGVTAMNQPINIFDTAFRTSPYPYLAELRRASPVCQVEPGGMWAVTRYEDVLFVLKNTELFSSGGFKVAWQPPWVGYN